MNKKDRVYIVFFKGKALEQCEIEVWEKNYKNLLAFSVLGLIMMSFSILFGWCMRHVFTFNVEFLLMWIYFLVMYVVMKYGKIGVRFATYAFYFWLTPLMVMGTMIGTFGDPQQPSITIMVFLCVLPMFVLDKPYRIVMFILFHSIVYTICCYFAKSNQLFVSDMIDLVLFTVLGVGVNCLILQDRIDNVEYAMNMRIMANTDVLTSLYNRRAGEEKTEELMNQCQNGIFVLIDVDKFKDINDTHGHANGDVTLKEIAMIIKNTFSKEDIVMRFGGDEFAVFAKEIKDKEEANNRIHGLVKSIRELSIASMPQQRFSISVGVTIWNMNEKKSFGKIFRESDKALYMAKEKGRNTFVVFDKE